VAVARGAIRMEDLPLGLRTCYERHLFAMRNRDTSRLDAAFELMLLVLATVRKPVSIDALRNVAVSTGAHS
jgi:hypothetical protein